MSEKIAVIVCASREAKNQTQDDVLEFLGSRADVEVFVAPHLVDLAADGAVMRRLREIDGEMLVVGHLQSRAIHWLLAKNGLEGPFVELEQVQEQDSNAQPTGPGPGRTVWCLGACGLGATEAVEACGVCLDEIAGRLGIVAKSGHKSEAGRIEEATSTRWYPVVDLDRCTNCLECLNFCLFGVYGLDQSESLAIDQPDACRPGCPACSRICPQGAIMFPDHHDPAISGDPRASAGGVKLDLLQIFGGAAPTAKAAGERDRALDEKKTDLDNLVDGLDELEL